MCASHWWYYLCWGRGYERLYLEPWYPMMSSVFLDIVFFSVSLVLVPPFLTGVIRKTKARLQNRIGAPLLQPFFDLVKLFRKEETLSNTASWVFRFSAALSVAVAFYLAIVVPWSAPRLQFWPCDLFLLLYLFAGMRLFTLLAAMDTASPFGAIAASREATLSFLVEPAAILSLAALGSQSQPARI